MKKRIISIALFSIILSANLPFALAAPSSSSESTSESASESTSESASELPPSTTYYTYPSVANPETNFEQMPSVNPGVEFIDNQQYYIPQPVYRTLNGTFVPSQLSGVPMAQPQFAYAYLPPVECPRLTLELTDEELLNHLASSSSSEQSTEHPTFEVKINRSIPSLPGRLPSLKSAGIKNSAPSEESFKPFKNKEENHSEPKLKTALMNFTKYPSPNPLCFEKVATYNRIEESLEVDRAFKYISNYIFEKSIPALGDDQNTKTINFVKNYFINSKNASLLYPVKDACLKFIDNSNFTETRKRVLKNFVDFSSALCDNNENIYTIILIYAQIVKLEDPTYDPTLSQYFKILSGNILKNFKTHDNFKIRDPKVYISQTENINRINSQKNFYFTIYRSILEDIFKGARGPKIILEKIKTDKYLNLVHQIEK